MPGISFICDFRGSLVLDESAISHALDSLIHTDGYKREILLNEKPYLLACTRYNEYPITLFESDDFSIYLEGQIYGRDRPSIGEELNRLAERIFQSRPRERGQITEWLLNTDGDFIVFVLNKKLNAVALLNDALGRLPLYYYNAEGHLVVTRELRFIPKLLGDVRFDRMAIAQYLLLSHPLGKRTLLENIHRLEPATLIVTHPDESRIEMENLNRLNFERRKHSGRTIQQNASELASLFFQACKNRASTTNKNVVSLSGGLDSRSVAGSLHKNNIAFVGTTYLDSDKAMYAADARTAEQLANLFGIDWKLFHLPPPRGKDLLTLLRIKNGLNYLRMSFILPYFDRVQETYGAGITFFTGDGGDQILQRDWRPPKNTKDIDELVEYIILTRQIFPLDVVARLTGMQKREIVEELKRVLLAYPENEWRQKYVHFITCEVGFSFYWEGEDRNRFYFWSVTPFYSIRFFDYVMNCPDRQKSQYALYRAFLSEVSPEASAIEYAGAQTLMRLPITSMRFKVMRSMVAVLSRFPNLKKKIISLVNPEVRDSYESNSSILDCLRDQLNSCETIDNYLSRSAIEDIIERCSEYNKFQIDTLFTVTSAIEELGDGKSTIEKYLETEFT